MYDELIKNLRNEANEAPALSSIGYFLMRQAADAIEELGVVVRTQKAVLDKFPRWIPVTERLPEVEKWVLCYCRANIYEVLKMRTSGDWVHDVHHIYMHTFVTHWMPLPKPPEKEEK